MGDYHSRLHQLAGSFPLVEFFALTYITDPQGNLLLIRKNENSCWELPGGAMQPDESVFECLQRTVLSVTNVFIEKGMLIQLFSDGELNYIDEDSANITPIYAVFIPTSVHGSLRISREKPVEFRFFASWNIPTDKIFPPMLGAIQYYRQHFPEGIPLQPLDLDQFAGYG
ncbi:MAG TPA: NUDIX domain-containing protein [Flexilinea sp.]|nr:NUDIX domain-containing protein [Flexilinea sp.]